MLIGEVLAVSAKADDTAVTTALTPWIAGWGNSAVFSYEILDITGPNVELKVKVYTKNTESADPGTQIGTTSTQSSAGTYSITDATNLLELVRLEFTLSVTGEDPADPWSTGVARVRALNPAWKTN